MTATDRVQGYWDEHASAFDALYREDRVAQRAFNRLFRQALYQRLELTVREVGALPAPTVLDVGCGSGRGSVALAIAGARQVVGIDFAPEMVRLAEGLAARHGVADRCTFLEGDFARHAFAERFDAVVALGVLDYVAEPAAFLRRMAALARRKVIASAPSPVPVRSQMRRWRYAREGCPVFFYTAERLRAVAAEAGLAGARLVPIGAGHLLVADLGAGGG